MAQFTNQAIISYRGVSVSSNIVSGEVTQVLRAWKDAAYDQYRAGDTLTYVVSLLNTGSAALNGLSVSDDLGAYSFGAGTLVPLAYTGDPVLYYINGILQSPPTVSAGPPMVISGLSALPGLSTMLIYRVTVNGYAPQGAGGQIINTATVSGGGLLESPAPSETVTANLNAMLSIEKNMSPATVVGGGQVTYTFTIHNSGATAALSAANLVVSDTFSPALAAPLVVTLNGAAWPMAGNYAYDGATGAFATLAGRVTVPGATYAQDATTGLWTTTSGTTVMTVSGVIA